MWLGETIVGGAVTPDTIVIDKRRARVLCRATGDNELMTVRGDEGTRIDAAPRELRRAPSWMTPPRPSYHSGGHLTVLNHTP